MSRGWPGVGRQGSSRHVQAAWLLQAIWCRMLGRQIGVIARHLCGARSVAWPQKAGCMESRRRAEGT